MKNKFKLFQILTLASLLAMVSCKEQPKEFLSLPSLFTENMVLQQNTEVAIWGQSSAKAKIKLTGSWGEEITAEANEKGEWMAKLKTSEAVSSAYELTIATKDTSIVIKNVLLGEVWLASGQSNMEMPLSGWLPNDTIVSSAKTIAEATNTDIRMFTVSRDVAFEPQADCKGTWEVSSPSSVGNFSATAYFFALKLYSELKVPIGIIHSSWGGTPAESWVRTDFLEKESDFNNILSGIKESLPQMENLKNWLDSLPKLEVPTTEVTSDFESIDYKDLQCASTDFNDSQWKTASIPKQWEKDAIGDFDGVVWYRKNIEIPVEWSGKELIVELGAIDDMDVTFLNGKEIGKTMKEGFWQQKRIYTITPDAFIAGNNILSVRIVDNQGGGGFSALPEEMKIYPKGNNKKAISLSGEWKYLPTAEYREKSLSLFGIENRSFYSRPEVKVSVGAGTPTVLYNAMIAPLVPYTIKGAIWYQGESNVGRAEQYSRIFPALINSWRESWKADFPFYFVQIAPYLYGEGSNSGLLRMSQLMSLKTEKTGMVVTLDIGNPKNIHPANKPDVGKRLALWALAKDYAKELVYSGPLFQSMEVKEGKIYLNFTEIAGGLVLIDSKDSGFEIAGSDGVYSSAKAIIEGNQVIVSSPKVKEPLNVRYAWKNDAAATLFNKEGLPASTFVTTVKW